MLDLSLREKLVSRLGLDARFSIGGFRDSSLGRVVDVDGVYVSAISVSLLLATTVIS